MARRNAFSLLELILAIGLSIALATLLGFAINLHVVRLDSSRTTIEQAQIARAVLDRIASDLQAVTSVPTQDVSELLKAAEAGASFDVDQIDSVATDTQDGEGEISSTPEAPAGLYGAIDSLQIDRRRIGQSLSTVEVGATPSARINAAWSRVTYSMSANTETPGLVRTETARDVSRWQTEQGQSAAVVEPIAPEVRGIRFEYFDGEQQVEAWDMAEQEKLPVAVQVLVDLAPANDVGDTTAPESLRKPQTYRRLVRLPASAEEAADESAGSEEAADQAAGDDSL